MSNTNHDFLVKNGLVVGQAITSTGTLTQAGQTFPASDGSAGQYLKTNGSGALSWGTVNTSFNITDGTTTDTVGSTETVTFTGGTNISLAVTDNTVTITNDVVDSDDITEGSSNLFYTDARAIAAIQGASNLTIDGGTLYVDTAADRVGISDTSPQQKLDVAGNIGVNGSEVIDASGNIVGSVADSAMTVGGSLAGVLSNLKVQYGTAYSGTPIQGSFFFDSLNQKLKVYTGSAFIDAVPAGSGGGGGGGATDANTTFRNYSYTLTGTTSAVSGVDDNELTAGAFIIGHKYTITSVGNTDFTGIGASGNTVGVVFTATGVGSGTGQAKQTLFYDTTSSTTRVVAYVNGIKQVYGSGRDFVATTGTSVAFTYNLGSGDTVDLQVYELLTNDAYYLKSEVYTQTQVNSQIATGVSAYLPLAGGTLTGGLDVNSTARVLANNALYFMNTNNSASSYLKNTLGAGAADLRLGVLGDDKVTILSNGNVGIGTTLPGENLEIHDTAMSTLSLSYEGNTGNGSSIDSNLKPPTAIAAPLTSQILFSDDGAYRQNIYFKTKTSATPSSGLSTRMTIAPDGDVGIGATIPTAKLHVEGTFQVRSSSSSIFNDTNNAENVRMLVSGTHFNADGADKDFRVESNNNTHMLFIDGGNDRVCIGHSSTGLFTTSARFEVDATSNSRTAGITTKSSALCLGLWNTNNSSGDMIQFSYGTNGTDVGSITHNGSGVTYNTTSDRRLKDNIEPISDATNKLMDMKPVTHTWIDKPEAPQVHGFIAQEMQEVIPEAVSGDAESDEMMSMDYGRITPVIVAALQDALKEIKELKTRIDELENK
jgi:hypothetical protein